MAYRGFGEGLHPIAHSTFKNVSIYGAFASDVIMVWNGKDESETHIENSWVRGGPAILRARHSHYTYPYT